MKQVWVLAFAALLVAAPAYAQSSDGSQGTQSHATTSKSAAPKRAPLPPGTRFVKRTCKTDSCKQKHPDGTYILPIKPKKTASS